MFIFELALVSGGWKPIPLRRQLCAEAIYAKTIAAVLLCLLLLLPARKVFSEQREIEGANSSEHVDAVLVLDASGSMLVNDPERLRYEGARLFLQFLSSGDRLAVIQFDDSAKILRPLSDFSPDQLPAIQKQLQDIQTLGEYTNLYGALTKAKDVLGTARRKDAQPMVILLSDGKMEPSPGSGSAEQLTESLSTQLLPEIKTSGVKVYTLALSDEADRHLLQHIAESTDGINWFTASADDIHKSFADLFLSAKKPQVVPMGAKGFTIDSNVDEATFYVNREDDSSNVELESPSGQRSSASSKQANVRWYQSAKFAVITVQKPEAGSWRISGISNQDGFATILTDLRLVTDWPNTINLGESTLLQARLYESKLPVSLPAMTDAIKYAFQITPVDKVSEPTVRKFLVDDGSSGDKVSGDGIFSYKIDVSEPGDYKLRVIAHAPTFERQLQLPFRVRPPFVTLRVHTAEEPTASESSLASSATPPVESPSKTPGVQQGDENTNLEIELSEEARSYKGVDVKVNAVDANKTRFSIAPRKTEGNALLFELPAAGLPHDGSYELQAVVSGEVKGKPVREESNKLRFSRKSTGLVPTSVEVKIVDKAAVPADIQAKFSWLGLVLVTLCNALCAGALIMLVKKKGSSSGQEITITPVSPEILGAIEDLKKRSQETEVRLDDPRLATQEAA